MDDSKLERIKKKIDSLKVISYEEEINLSNGKFMSIVNGKYNLNNGKTIFREKINKNIGIGSAVCIFTVTKDNNIVLVIEPRCALPTESKVNIEIPAGYIDNGEDKLEAAKRELVEETGYVCGSMIYLDSYYPSQGGSGECIDLFLALDCYKDREQHLDFDEFIEYIEVSFSEYVYLINNNYMLDANSRIAYYKATSYILNNKLSNVVNKLIKNKETISAMESCTGGEFTNSITNIENSSKVLRFSAVTYSNEYKKKLGVSEDTILKYSVYSKECAREMAYNISNYSNSTYGVGITGTLLKYDDNNESSSNDKVYICIYDKKRNKYYDYDMRVSSNIRINNKRLVVINIANYLEEIDGCFAFIGGGDHPANHHGKFDFDEKALISGVRLMLTFVIV